MGGAQAGPQSIMKSIADASQYSRPVGTQQSTARVFLSMGESLRHNPQALMLVAQRDPVMLARLLCAAMADIGPVAGKSIATAGDAIEVLGTTKVNALLLPLVHTAMTCPAATTGSPLVASERFVMRRCLAHVQTAFRLSRYLELTASQAALLQLALLLDSLGLFPAIYSNHPDIGIVHIWLADKEAASDFILRGNADLPHATILAEILAKEWQAGDEVIDALKNNTCEIHALMLACEKMVQAKLHKTSQQAALLDAVTAQPHWRECARMDEIDLAVAPW